MDHFQPNICKIQIIIWSSLPSMHSFIPVPTVPTSSGRHPENMWTVCALSGTHRHSHIPRRGTGRSLRRRLLLMFILKAAESCFIFICGRPRFLLSHDTKKISHIKKKCHCLLKGYISVGLLIKTTTFLVVPCLGDKSDISLMCRQCHFLSVNLNYVRYLNHLE